MDLEKLYRRSPSALQTVFLNAAAARIWVHRYGRPYRRALREIIQHDDWSLDEIRRFQDERLRKVVSFAGERSVFYKRIFSEHGIHAGEFQGTSDLEKVPILTKSALRENLQAILTSPEPQGDWLHGHTSGTTGSPLSLWYDRGTAVLNNAVDARQKAWAGMGPRDWIGLLLGRMIVSPGRQRPPFWKPNYVLRQVWFSAFHLQAENLPTYVSEIRRRKLRFLEGYPSTMFILAQHILRSGERLPLQAVFTSSETLHGVQREVIEDAFQCGIYDFYGHAERTIFAAECECHSGKHLAEEYGFTEVVDGDGKPVRPGEVGYLVGTSLHNLAMPLIRYRTGDLSSIIEEPCACGRRARRIADVSTKAEDIVVTPDGRFLSPSVLTHPFKPFVTIRQSQIIQESMDRISVRIVAGDDWTAEKEQQLRDALEDRLGRGVSVLIERVDHIPREPSGKFRWVISKVDHSARFSWN